MMTATATREPHAEADNTAKLQRMLDMEHKLKIERLHPLIPTSEMPKRRPATMQPPPRSSLPLQARRKGPHVRGGSLVMNAAMIKMADDSDNLHIRVPTPPWRASKSNRLEPMPLSRAITPQNFTTLPTIAPANEEDDSDASSICHSPSWEGYDQRKKDKKAGEKQRRKEKEQAEKDTRDAKRKAASRLIKRPPSASRTNQILSGRSTSTPELLDQATSRRSSMQSDHSQLQPPPKHSRQRSSSVASQIRAALTGYLGGKDDKEKETGFVGGLKLEMERDSASRLGTHSKSPNALRPAVAPGPQKPHSYGPDSTAARAAKAPSPTPPTLPRTMTDGTVRGPSPLRHKGPSPLSMLTSSRSDTLISPTVPPSVPGLEKAEKWRGPRDTARPAADVDHAAHASESEAEDSSRGRASGSYVYHQRQLSQERAISGFKEDAKVSVKSRYPPQAHRRYQGMNFGTPTDGSSPTSSNFGSRKTSSNDSRSSSAERGRFLDSLGSFGQPYHAPSLDLTTPDAAASRGFRDRSRSSDKNSRGFKGAMQAAFQRVRTSSKPPSASSSFFERHSRDTMTTPDSFAMSRPTSSDVEKTPDMSFTLDDFKPPVIKDPNGVRSPSSASSSLYEESMRSPALTNTPDSSRPQSDKGLPPVVGEVGKGRADTLLVTNDERVFRLSHRATMADSTPAASSPLTPRSASNLDLSASDSNIGLAIDNPQGHIHPLLRKAKSRPALIQADQVSSMRLNTKGSKSSLGPYPRNITPVPGPRDRSPSALGKAEDTVGASLSRVPSLSKSKSSPNMKANAQCRAESPLVPPQRSPAREKHTFQPSMSPPDAPGAAADSAAGYPRSPKPATYLEKARRAAPSATSPPQPLRPSRGPGGRSEGEFEPIAKMFVECCHCKFFHDMPSKVYECMVHPDATVEDPRLGVSGAISTVVNCPWCRHGMTTQCCAGYAAVVHLKERLH